MTHSIVQFKSSWYWIRPLGIICNRMHSFKSYYKQYTDTHRVVSTCQHCIAFPLEGSTAWIERYTNVKFSSRIRSGSSTWPMQCSTVDPIRLYVLPSPVLSTHSSSHALLRGSSNGPWFNSFRKDQESRVWFTNIPLRSAGILVSIVDWPIETCWSWDAILSRKKSWIMGCPVPWGWKSETPQMPEQRQVQMSLLQLLPPYLQPGSSVHHIISDYNAKFVCILSASCGLRGGWNLSLLTIEVCKRCSAEIWLRSASSSHANSQAWVILILTFEHPEAVP